METLAKSDAFFFITSIAVILFTILALVILFYVIRFARIALQISKKVKEESDNISHDIAKIRARVNEEGFGIRTVYRLVSGFFGNNLGKNKTDKRAKSGARTGKSSKAHHSEDEDTMNG